MVQTAQATLLVPAEDERDTTVCTVPVQEPDPATRITEGDKILAERLYSVREHQGVTRVVVAAETGISYESLTGYELGDQRAPFSRVRLLAIYYGVSLDYFAGRTDRLVRRTGS